MIILSFLDLPGYRTLSGHAIHLRDARPSPPHIHLPVVVFAWRSLAAPADPGFLFPDEEHERRKRRLLICLFAGRAFFSSPLVNGLPVRKSEEDLAVMDSSITCSASFSFEVSFLLLFR